MSILVARHSLSEANNRYNYGKPAFGHPNAPLMPEGRAIAQAMGTEFETRYSIIPSDTAVAVSGMLRAQETAREAGFTKLTEYDVLNEVDTLLPYPELRSTIDQRQHTAIALEAAQDILNNPPKEAVWVSHGLVIASLCEVLGIAHKFEHFVPRFCEIRELPL